MSVVPKFAIGGEAKKTVTVNNKERAFNEEDYDKSAAAHIATLPEIDREEASKYYNETLKPNLINGKLNLDLGGDKALAVSVESQNNLSPFNKVYSEQELKAMPRSERKRMINKQNIYAGLNNAVFNNVASLYNKSDADDKIKTDKTNADNLALKFNNLGLSSNYSTSLYGKEGGGEQGESQARLAYAKADEKTRQSNLIKWISNHAQSIYGLDENDESTNNEFKSKYNLNLKDIKDKLNAYRNPNGQFNINWQNLRSASSVLGKELMLNEYLDNKNISNWKNGQFTNQVSAVQQEKAKSDAEAVAAAANPVTTPTQSTVDTNGKAFTGIKNGLRYNNGALYTGFLTPKIADPDNFNYGEAFGNSNNYGLFQNGKRIPDIQAINFYNKLSQEDKTKLYPTFNQDIKSYYKTPSNYVNIGEIDPSGKDLVRTLRTSFGTGGKKLADLTEEYSNPLKNGRLIAAIDNEKAVRSGTPWTNHVKYYFASKNANGNDVILPAKMGQKLDGTEFVDYKDLNGNWKREIIGSRVKRPADAHPFTYTNHAFNSNDGTEGNLDDNQTAIQKTMRATIKKEGGTLRRYQYGGGLVAIGKDSPKQTIPQQLTSRKSTPITNKEFKNTSWDDISGSDKADIAALGFDTASMVASLVPGAQFTSGGLGALGTLTSFGADWARDGLDMEDVGRLGMGLALDATSLIPGAGAFSSKAKFFNKIEKLSKPLKYISKGLMAAGAMQSAKSISKLFDEKERDNMTVDDWRNIASGLTMFTRGVKATTHDIGKVKDEFHTFNIKDKEGNILKAKIDSKAKSQLDAIESIPEKEKFLKTLAKNQFNLKNESDLELLKSNKTTPFKTDGKWSINPLAKSEGDVKLGLGKENARFMTKEELENRSFTDRILEPSFFGNRNRNKYESINKNIDTSIGNPAIINQPNYKANFYSAMNPNIQGRSFNIGNFANRRENPALFKLNEDANGFDFHLRNKFPELTPRYIGSNDSFSNKNIPITPSFLRNQIGEVRDIPRFFMPQSVFKRNLGVPLDADVETVRDAIKNQGLKTEVYANQLGLEFDDKLARYYVYKKGGLIPKHKLGKTISNLVQPIVEPTNKNFLLEAMDNRPKFVPESTYQKNIDKPNTPVNLNRFNNNKLNLNNQVIQPTGLESALKVIKPLVNKVDPVFVADYIRNSINNRNTLNNRPIIDAATMQQSAEPGMASVSTLNKDAYYNAANSVLASNKNQTSDIVQNSLMNRSSLNEANKLRMQGDNQYAQALDQNNMDNMQLQGQYAQERSKIANANMAAINQANNQNNQYKAALNDVVHRNDDQFANRWLSKFQQDQQVEKENNFEDKMFDLQNRMQNPIRNLTNQSNLLYGKISNGTATDAEKEEYSGITDQFNNLSNVRQATAMMLRRNPKANIDFKSLNSKYGVTSSYAAGGSFEMQMFKENNRLAEREYQNKLKITDKLNKNLNSNYVTNLKASLSTLNNILKNK